MHDILDFPPLLKESYEATTRPICRKHGLTASELDILLFLANHPHYDRASEIVKRRFIAKSQVSASVASLQGKGYLTVCAVPGDRRTSRLALTEAANAAVTDGKAAQERFFSALLDGFSEDERLQMLHRFDRMIENLNRFLQEESQ